MEQLFAAPGATRQAPSANPALAALVVEESQAVLRRWHAADFFLLPLAYLARAGRPVPEGLLSQDDSVSLLAWTEEQLSHGPTWSKARAPSLAARSRRRRRRGTPAALLRRLLVS
jgi:hypothetical protein